jgi:hypothetical protein
LPDGAVVVRVRTRDTLAPRRLSENVVVRRVSPLGSVSVRDPSGATSSVVTDPVGWRTVRSMPPPGVG